MKVYCVKEHQSSRGQYEDYWHTDNLLCVFDSFEKAKMYINSYDVNSYGVIFDDQIQENGRKIIYYENDYDNYNIAIKDSSEENIKKSINEIINDEYAPWSGKGNIFYDRDVVDVRLFIDEYELL